jgi:hypothetical protein
MFDSYRNCLLITLNECTFTGQHKTIIFLIGSEEKKECGTLTDTP